MKLSKPITVREVAELFNVEYKGDPDMKISGINEIHKVEHGDIAYVDTEKYYSKTLKSNATVIIINKSVDVPQGKALLISNNPFRLYNELVERYMQKLEDPPHQIINYISPDATIGEGSVIYPGVYIANNVTIGKDCTIHPNTVIYNNVIIGDRAVIKANAVIGSDAFYFTNYQKWHSCGRVILEDDVEIGASSTIDKGVSGDTVIGEKTKIDSQVHIGHGVVVGKRCIFAAEVGIAGKTIVGDDVVMLGQGGVVKDVKIGNKALLLSKSLITKDVKGDTTYFGTPAQDTKVAYKELAALRRLPTWMNEINEKIKAIWDK